MPDRAFRTALEPSDAGERQVFLLGFDLEDVRSMVPGGSAYREAVPRTTGLFLDLLARHDMRVTFFVVGDVARRYPGLIREIADRGHELACHSSDHLPLDRHGRASFRSDLERNRDDLLRAGAPLPLGFRAPIFSLTPTAGWAYEVLAELGFRYSSSVLPRSHPLYGWESFGEHPVRTDTGVWEIPISTNGLGRLGIPFAGGIYFRVLPLAIVRELFRRRRSRGAAVVGYLHPYDLDVEQERFAHPGLGDRRWMNALMYVHRGRVLPRLTRLLADGWRLERYGVFVSDRLERRAPAGL
jgi:polysaccharide deacetylase family protein (PEP-CTERM system associated)